MEKAFYFLGSLDGLHGIAALHPMKDLTIFLKKYGVITEGTPEPVLAPRVIMGFTTLLPVGDVHPVGGILASPLILDQVKIRE